MAPSDKKNDIEHPGDDDSTRPQRQAAQPGEALSSDEVPAGTGAPSPSEPHEMIESNLLGDGGGLEPASPRAADETAREDGLAEVVDEQPGVMTMAAAAGSAAFGGAGAGIAGARATGDAEVDALGGEGDAALDAAEERAAERMRERASERERAQDRANHDRPAAAPVPAAEPSRSGSGFVPMALGGAVAAALGAAAAIWAMPHLPQSWQGTQPIAEAPAAPEIDTDAILADAAREATEAASSAAAQIAQTEAASAIEARADLIRQIAEDAAREVIAELPETGAGTPEEIQAAITAQNQRIDELDTRLAALTEQVEAAPQPAPSPATEAAPEPAPAAAPETAPEPAPAQPEAQPQPAPDLGPLEDSIAALQSRLDEQQAKLDELAARPEIDEAQIAELRDLADSASATRDEIEAAAADARARIDAVQADADAASERAQAVASFASLRSALESGADRSAALGDLQAAGVQVPEALSAAEIPTLDALQAEFDPAARAALRASLQSQSTGGLGAVGNFLRVQSGARSVEPRAGGDPDAVLSRADAAVGAGDIQRALDELAALPEAGQAAMEEWTARARAYLAAGAALDDVSGSLN